MREQNFHSNESSWDCGTYQTGPRKRGGSQSPAVTVLLMSVIFLGGICCALGVMNFRLLSKLLADEQSAGLAMKGETDTELNTPFWIEETTAALPDNGVAFKFAEGRGQELANSQLSELIDRCVVSLQITAEDGQVVDGVALVVSEDGYLVANAGLADGGRTIVATFADGSEAEAYWVASDVYSDISVLYVRAEGLSVAEFSEDTEMDDPLYIFPNRELVGGKLLAQADQDQLFRTDFEANAGPVFNDRGEVVGLLCDGVSGDRGNGKAISGKRMEQIVQELVEKGGLSGCPYLAFRAEKVSTLCRQYWELSAGVQITKVLDGSCGLRVGDILLSVDGEEMASVEQLYGLIGQIRENKTLQLQILRSGQQFEMELTVDIMP